MYIAAAAAAAAAVGNQNTGGGGSPNRVAGLLSSSSFTSASSVQSAAAARRDTFDHSGAADFLGGYQSIYQSGSYPNAGYASASYAQNHQHHHQQPYNNLAAAAYYASGVMYPHCPPEDSGHHRGLTRGDDPHGGFNDKKMQMSSE